MLPSKLLWHFEYFWLRGERDLVVKQDGRMEGKKEKKKQETAVGARRAFSSFFLAPTIAALVACK